MTSCLKKCTREHATLRHIERQSKCLPFRALPAEKVPGRWVKGSLHFIEVGVQVLTLSEQESMVEGLGQMDNDAKIWTRPSCVCWMRVFWFNILLLLRGGDDSALPGALVLNAELLHLWPAPLTAAPGALQVLSRFSPAALRPSLSRSHTVFSGEQLPLFKQGCAGGLDG